MNPRHLLEQAERLATEGTGRPRQADLRRAASTAYYALFHLLTQAGGRLVTRLPAAQPVIARQFGHKEMKDASRPFAAGRLPEAMQDAIDALPSEITQVAATLIQLQELRHRADYDLSADATYTKAEVVQLLADVRAAFDAWERLRTGPAVEVYLLAMLFHPLGR
jgi:hypothetical protein